MSLESGHFKAALKILDTALQKRINQTAHTSLANDILCVAMGLRPAALVDQLYLSQNDVERIQSMFHHSPRFSQLDMLSIGQDHIFIVNRELLLEDIKDYLARSPQGLRRVFVNVDHRLPQPEIMPKNRYRELEDYIEKSLQPELEFRIRVWDQAVCYRPLDIPRKLSLVTLTGWMLSYPVIYVLPRKLSRERSSQLQEGTEQNQEEEGNNGHGDADDDEEEDEENGRNCLANQLLVVTRVQLEPSDQIEGLKDHCLLSFSYPWELAERFMDRSLVSPESPCLSPYSPMSLASSPSVTGHGQDEDEDEEEEDEEDDDDDEFVDASDIEYMETDLDGSPLLAAVRKAKASNPTHSSTTATTVNRGLNDTPAVMPLPMPLPMLQANTGSQGPGLRQLSTTPLDATSLPTSSSPSFPTPSLSRDATPRPSSSSPSFPNPSSLPLDATPRPTSPSPSFPNPLSLPLAASPEIPTTPSQQQQEKPRRQLSNSKSFGTRPTQLLLNNPDICAAGRSFLYQLHTRFQKQSLWKAWEIGQQTVTLPVVAM